jgi:N-acetylneuraminic acid mutarotase
MSATGRIATHLRWIALSLAALLLCAGCVLDEDLGPPPEGFGTGPDYSATIDDVTFTGEFTNVLYTILGPQNQPGVQLNIWLHRNSAPTVGESGGITSGGPSNEQQVASFTSILSSGTAYILVDSANSVQESDETNNVASRDWTRGSQIMALSSSPVPSATTLSSFQDFNVTVNVTTDVERVDVVVKDPRDGSEFWSGQAATGGAQSLKVTGFTNNKAAAPGSSYYPEIILFKAPCCNRSVIYSAAGPAATTYLRRECDNYNGGARTCTANENSSNSGISIPYLTVQGGSTLWVERAPMATARSSHASTVLNGKIYVFGGQSAAGSVLNSVEEYDPALNAWTARASMPTARYKLAACALGQSIYVLGGQGAGTLVQVHDPAANSWSTRNPLPNDCSECRCGTVAGKLYVIAWSGGNTNLVEYNPAGDSWISRSPFTTVAANRFGFATAAFDGKLFVLGGSGAALFSGVLAFNPASNSWSELAAMQKARGEFGAAASSTRLYAISGSLNAPVPDVEAYDPVANTWTAKASLPQYRGGHSAEVVNGMVYVLAGTVNAATTNTVLRYDPATEP